MEKKEVKWSKLFALGLGGVVGLSYLGMIGTLINRESKLPSINVPVGPYTAYEAEVGKEGYKIKYRANDPLVMHVERDSNTKGGFLGLANNKVKIPPLQIKIPKRTKVEKISICSSLSSASSFNLPSGPTFLGASFFTSSAIKIKTTIYI